MARATQERTSHPGVYKRGEAYIFTFRRGGRQHWGRRGTFKEAVDAKILADAGAELPGPVTPAAAADRWRDLVALQAATWQGLLLSPYVYFLVAPNAGAVKIGSTGNLIQRVRSLQAHAPELLSLVFVARDEGDGLEAELHRRFASEKRNGEWFALTGDLAQVLSPRGILGLRSTRHSHSHSHEDTR